MQFVQLVGCKSYTVRNQRYMSHGLEGKAMVYGVKEPVAEMLLTKVDPYTSRKYFEVVTDPRIPKEPEPVPEAVAIDDEKDFDQLAVDPSTVPVDDKPLPLEAAPDEGKDEEQPDASDMDVELQV